MARPPRMDGFSYRGLYRYSITICVYSRRPAFMDAAAVAEVLSVLRPEAAAERFDVVVFCCMPDHLHVLVEGQSEESDLRDFVSRFKQRTGYAYARRSGRRLWQQGYFDHVLRPTEDIRRAARYIVENPVRAGIVLTPDDHPFSGSDVYTWPELLTDLQNT